TICFRALVWRTAAAKYRGRLATKRIGFGYYVQAGAQCRRYDRAGSKSSTGTALASGGRGFFRQNRRPAGTEPRRIIWRGYHAANSANRDEYRESFGLAAPQ